eukprot:6692114-Alexandrium_andersonii.AAC.1
MRLLNTFVLYLAHVFAGQRSFPWIGTWKADWQNSLMISYHMQCDPRSYHASGACRRRAQVSRYTDPRFDRHS